MKKRIISVKRNDSLIKYLSNEGFSKNNVKTLVKLGIVYVNNKRVVKLPYDVVCGDVISIDDGEYNRDFGIVYEDDNYLVVNKEEGVLSISTSSANKNFENTLYRMVREYLNNKKEKAFIVNRIDKETSGLVIFVKNLKLKEELQSNWNVIVKERLYVAVVSGNVRQSGRIDNYLYEDKLTFVHSTNYGGKRAITNYKVIKNNTKYSMLDVNIETGRKNQIRVHMKEMGHPIVGDKKYGCKDNSLHRLCLHHYRISLMDPVSGKILSFSSEVPSEFERLLNNN